MLTRRHAWGISGSIGLLILIADLFSKHLAQTVWASQPWSWGSWFELTYSENPGIAFGLKFGGLPLLIVSVLLMGAFLVYAHTMLDFKRLSVKLGVGLILGGALGNFWDRLTLGVVRDFIQVGSWHTFNLADAALSIGLVCLILSLYLLPHDSRRHA